MVENRRYFAIMTPHTLASCVKDLYTVCPPDLVLKTPGGPNCVIALFLGKADVMSRICRRLILNDDFESAWIRSPDFNL